MSVSGEPVSIYLERLQKNAAERYGVEVEQCHVGHLFLESMLMRPDLVHQIDAATGESYTNLAVLRRTVALAQSMKTLGLRQGDVICVTGLNYPDLCLPMYAGPCCGFRVMAIDGTLKTGEFKQMFAIGQPKLIFCSTLERDYIKKAITELNSNAIVVTFDRSDMDLSTFLTNYGDKSTDIYEFRPDVFDLQTDCYLLSTSGTVGLPKLVPLTHYMLLNSKFIGTFLQTMPAEGVRDLNLSLCQWMSSLGSYVNTPIMGLTRIQTSRPFDEAHVAHILKTYKPHYGIFAPPRLAQLLQHEDCDFSSFKFMMVGGSAVSPALLAKIKARTNGFVISGYGMTELCGGGLGVQPDSPMNSPGRPLKSLETRLVDLETGKDVEEPNQVGELWLKGKHIFKGYYNMPEETAKVFTEDGYFKTGDLFYRDESDNYYFVDRHKVLIKYRNYQVSPTELETLISSHPGVADVAVTGIPSELDGELVVAFVVRDAAYKPPVTADEVKNLVKDKLQDSKQIRGGVYFVESLPQNVNGKLDRMKLKEQAKNEFNL